jgi:hypothetical protein
MPLVNKTFSDIITFTRASTATYFDATGTLQSAAIDDPRLDYDPATLAARGFLIEEQRTNLALYSAKLDQFSSPAVWVLTGAGATLTATTDIAAPDGTMTAWTLTSSGAQAQIQQAPTVVISTVYTGSFWIRRRSGTGTINIRVVENVNTPLTGVTSQWQRFNFTATSTSTTGRLGVFLSGLSDEVDIWGAQLEAGAFPTSYIPTTTTSLTRSADVASVNTLSPWYNAAAGTVYVEFVWEGLKSVAGQRIVSFDDGTNSNYWSPLSTSGSGMQGVVQVGGVAEAVNSTPSTIFSAGVLYKQALALELNNSVSAINGTAGTPDTSVTVPTVNTLRLGANTSGATNNIWFRRITYYPRRLSNAELQAITA